MRGKLFAALLCTTALASPVDAAPVAGFLVGAFAPGAVSAVGGLTLGSAFAGGFYAGAGFSVTGLGAIAAVGVRVAVSYGLSRLADNLSRRNSVTAATNPSATAQSQARLTNFAQPITAMEYVFGRVRKGGPLGFTGFADNKRFYAPIFAAHPCHGVVEHWMDEQPVSLSAGTVTSGNPAGYGGITFYDGSASQAADPNLSIFFPEINSTHNFKRLCYAVCYASRPAPEDFSSVYPSGRQWAYAPVIDGWNEIYDPRDATYKYTNNAALVIAHWATQILGATVDWDEVATEANASDVLVSNKQTISELRWTINGIISDDQDYETQREQLALAADVFFYERTDGGLGFKVGRWIAPTVALQASDFYSLNEREGDWGANEPNEIAIEYIEPANDWKETVSGAWVEDASSRRVREVVQAYMVNSHNQAARIAKRLAKVKHAPSKITGTLGIIGAELIGQRFFTINHAEAGISTTYEVGELRRDGDVWTVSAVEATEADFNFNAATEEPDKNEYSSVTSTDAVVEVSGVTATAVAGNAVDVDWTAADASLTQQIQLCDDGGANCQIYTVPNGQRPYRIFGLVDGAEYQIKMRNRTAALRVSDWKPDTPVTVTAIQNLTAPAIVTDVALTEDAGDILVDFISPNDPAYAGAQIFRADYASAYAGPFDIGDASLIATAYSAANLATQHVDESPSVGVYAYWIKSINSSGTASGPTAVETIEIT